MAHRRSAGEESAAAQSHLAGQSGTLSSQTHSEQGSHLPEYEPDGSLLHGYCRSSFLRVKCNIVHFTFPRRYIYKI